MQKTLITLGAIIGLNTAVTANPTFNLNYGGTVYSIDSLGKIVTGGRLKAETARIIPISKGHVLTFEINGSPLSDVQVFSRTKVFKVVVTAMKLRSRKK